MEWWNGLSVYQRDWFVISGMLMLAVAGFSVGVVGIVNVATLEPLMHLGLAVGIASTLGSMFTAMARLT